MGIKSMSVITSEIEVELAQSQPPILPVSDGIEIHSLSCIVAVLTCVEDLTTPAGIQFRKHKGSTILTDFMRS